MAVATLAVAFASSAYAGRVSNILEKFKPGELIGTIGISLFACFGLPLVHSCGHPFLKYMVDKSCSLAPHAVLTFFNAGAAGANNITALIAMRLIAGLDGSSPLTNARGVIEGIFNARNEVWQPVFSLLLHF